MNPPIHRAYEFGPFRVDAEERLLLRDGQVIPVTAKVFDILLLLVQHNGHLLEKGWLMQNVWPDTFVEEGNLTRNISTLRRALGEDSNGQYIQTFPRRGYRFVADVRVINGASTEVVLSEATKTHVIIDEEWKREVQSLVTAVRWLKAILLTKRIVLSGVAAVALFGVAVWLWFSAVGSRSQRPPMKVVPLLTSQATETEVAFSPDGDRIAFAAWNDQSGSFDIFVKMVEGGNLLRLTDNAAIDRAPVWSPDSRYIAFTRQRGGGMGFYLIPALGGAERRLAEVGGITWPQISWSSDGKMLATPGKGPTDKGFSIFLVTVETSERQRLTAPPPDSSDSRPAFSPDGQTIAFVRENFSGHDIFVVPTRGGEPRRLTFHNAQLNTLTWTADGREIIFSSSRESNAGGLWRVPVNGGEPRWIAVAGTNAFYPAISNSDNRLAYTYDSTDVNIWRVEFAIDSDPGQATRFIASTQSEYGPQFSPDGLRIAFISGRASDTPEVWTCAADGSKALQLTTLGAPDTGGGGPARWSPDGHYLAFASNPSNNQDIFTIAAEGGAPRRLTAEPEMDRCPSWSRDGRWIYFGSNRTGMWQVWKMPAAGGDAVQVTVDGGYFAVESHDGQELFYVKPDTPGLWKAPANGGTGIRVLDFPDTGRWANWALTREGVLYINSKSKPVAVEYYEFRTGHVRKIANGNQHWAMQGLDISPDGKSVLYTQLDQHVIDIMLLDDFR